MDTSSRRAFLQAVIEAEDSSTRDRLKASELLDRLDERDGPQRPPDPPLPVADLSAKLARQVGLSIEYGLYAGIPAFRELVERRAEELVEERAREARAAMREASRTAAAQPEQSTTEDMADDLAGPEEGSERVGDQAARNSPAWPEDSAAVKSATSETSGVDAADPPPALEPAVLARQWPDRNRPRGLRDVRPSSSLGRDRFDE